MFEPEFHSEDLHAFMYNVVGGKARVNSDYDINHPLSFKCGQTCSFTCCLNFYLNF